MENNNYDEQLSELFRDTDELLSEQPSARAWSRLEGRLEQKRSAQEEVRQLHRRMFWRNTGVAAAMMAMVMLLGVMTLLFLQNKEKGKLVEYKPTPKIEQVAAQETEITPITNENTTTPTKISKADEILQPQKNTTVTATPTAPVPQIAANNSNNQNNGANSNTNSNQNEAKYAPPAPAKLEEAADRPQDRIAEKEISSAPVAAKADISVGKTAASRVSNAAFPDVIKSAEAAKKPTARAEKPAAPAKKAKHAAPDNTATINDLYWLIGHWRDSDDEQPSYEKWEASDAKTLIGSGYLLHQGKRDTSRLESFNIRQEGTGLAFYIPIDYSSKMHRYELLAHTASRWVFENDAMAFPQQIVLSRAENGTYSIDMRNTDPFKLPSEQVKFLSRRNNVLKDEVTRTMQRVAK